MKTTLILECEEAQETPLVKRSAAQLLTLISQSLDVEASIPRAIGMLQENPLLEAEYYQGDLLRTVLEVDQEYWGNHQTEWLQLHSVLGNIDQAIAQISKSRKVFVSMIERKRT